MVNALTATQAGIYELECFEIGSKELYEAKFTRPTLPNKDSGITIGVGLDCGFSSKADLQDDLQDYLPQVTIDRFKSIQGFKGESAKNMIHVVADIQIHFDIANKVFINKTLPRFCRALVAAYPGVEKLRPDAVAALLSLVYNRGTLLVGSRRVEMANIKPLVAAANYDGIANEIIKMKKLWTDGGLLKRRDKEAARVRISKTANDYQPNELYLLTF